MKQTRLLVIFSVTASVAMLVWLVMVITSASSPKNLELLVAPSAAALSLDGKTVGVGKHAVSRGKHTVTATMRGFADSTQSVTVGEKLTTLRIIMIPNSKEGERYLQDHPEEQSLIEQYDGMNFKDYNTKTLTDNPILEDLPYISVDKMFRIDAGSASSDDDKLSIYITAVDSQSVKSAKSWITQSGHSLKSLDLHESIEPLLNKLPYKTTDYAITPDYRTTDDGSLKMGLTVLITLSGADAGNPDAAAAIYKQAAINRLKSLGVNPDNYAITYIVR